jgi:hypothetical protein
MTMHALILYCALCGVSDETYQAWTSSVIPPNPRKAAPKGIGRKLSADEISKLTNEAPPIPFKDVTVAVKLTDGTVWAGSSRGLMRRGAKDSRWKLFHSRRWLAEDPVADLLVVSSDSCYVRNPSGGVNWIRQRPMTLQKKIAAVHSHLQQRAVRLGLIAEVGLDSPGNLKTNFKQPDSDNNGLWTSMYVAAEAFRFGVTAEPEAKQNAQKSLRGMLNLESITGLPGYVARSVATINTPLEQLHDQERWRVTKDGTWRWKSDTSSDEIDGHYFMYAIYYDICADDTEKTEIRAVISRITDHIIANDYLYIDTEGKRTMWGVWSPKLLNEDPEWAAARGLNSLEILSHLKVAHHITGDAKYDTEYKKLIEKHHYAENTVNQKVVHFTGHTNHSDDELAFLAYYPLLIYERDPKLRETYMKSLKRTWDVERAEKSPFFNFIYAAALQAEKRANLTERPAEAGVDPQAYDLDVCVDWLRDVPEDLVSWTVDNRGRNDVVKGKVFPPSERRTMKWNGNPYTLTGGDGGTQADDGTFILLPYWMGRWHRFID